jgi:hypothetical protein
MQVPTNLKKARMMVEVQELMSMVDVYKPGEERVRAEATGQTQRDMEQATEKT